MRKNKIAFAFGGGELRTHDLVLIDWLKLKQELIDIGYQVDFYGHYWDYCDLDPSWTPHLTSVEKMSPEVIENWAKIDVAQRTHRGNLNDVVFHCGQHFSGLFAFNQIKEADLVLRARWDSMPVERNYYLLEHLINTKSPTAFTYNILHENELRTHDVGFMFNASALENIKQRTPFRLLEMISEKYYTDLGMKVTLSAHDLWDDILRMSKVKRVNFTPIATKIIR